MNYSATDVYEMIDQVRTRQGDWLSVLDELETLALLEVDSD